MTRSNPAASQSAIASRVKRPTPPSVPDDGEGRTKAFSFTDNVGIRVLSPSMDPPLTTELGSTVSTATEWPRLIMCPPSVSMKVDLPAPGGPVIPIRSAGCPGAGSAASNSLACDWCSLRPDSTRVIACASARRSCFPMASASEAVPFTQMTPAQTQQSADPLRALHRAGHGRKARSRRALPGSRSPFSSLRSLQSHRRP